MESFFYLLVRALLVITGVSLLALCVGFFTGYPEVVTLWPWPDSKLSYIFIASIFAAIGAPVLWMGMSGELAAMRGGALDFATNYLGLAITLVIAGEAVNSMLSVPLFFSVLIGSFVFNALVFFAIKNVPFKDQRPVPFLLRFSFLVIVQKLLPDFYRSNSVVKVGA